jgi:hypothetical protein
MTLTKNEKLANYFANYIENNEKYNKLFSHHKRLHKPKQLFLTLIHKLETGLSYAQLDKKYFGISKSALHNFNVLVGQHKIFYNFYEYYLDLYVTEMSDEIKTLFVDSTLVANKLGIDSTTYNCQLQKHRSTKISIVEDNFNIPIDIIVTKSSQHDASICMDHIYNIAEKAPILCSNDKILVGDTAYDSSNIKKYLKETEIGTLVWFA